ncbi:MAG: hypothetical protein ACPG9E_00235 [Poseidonia sp.]
MDTSALLGKLYQARFDDLKSIAQEHGIAKSGPVESLRARLIRHLIFPDWDFSPAGLRSISNSDLGEILGLFGIKKSGSIKARRQRLHLHLNHDPKSLAVERLDDMTRDQLHAMCKDLELALSGNKQALLARVAGVLASQENAWGKVKKSLRRPKGPINVPQMAASSTSSAESSVEETVASFVEDHDDGWTYEEELTLKAGLADVGHDVSSSMNDADLERQLRPEPAEEVLSVPPMIQHTGAVETHSLETETALMELRERHAEIQAFARDFLMVSSTTNQDDMNAFIASLRAQGFATDLPPVHQAVAQVIMELDFHVQNESKAATAMPQSWSEREALRRFEEVRSTLRDRLENILALHASDVVKARMAFEQEGRELELDLRVPSVSGRLHALFDLHIEIAESQALHDPVVQRRQRMMRILHRGAVHMPESERMTIERLERNISSFEELVQTILESGEEGFDDAQQALVIRFLESKGYDVNTSTLRPRILACAGILGAELGYLSPSEIPRIAPGVLVTETEVDAIVTELKSLAASFKPSEEQVPEEEAVAESVADASDSLARVRGKIDRVDELLNRLNG